MGKEARRNKAAREALAAMVRTAPPPLGHGDQNWLELNAGLETGDVVDADEKLTYDAGFRATVVYSRNCYERHVEWNKGGCIWQSETGRAWDVLMLSAIALRFCRSDFGQAISGIDSVPPGKQVAKNDSIKVAWLGDEYDEPVILIMREDESVRAINDSIQRAIDAQACAPSTQSGSDLT